MKPRVFVGSSVENLSIAYAIQESLDFDSQVTVWTQGIFKLSSSALDDLIVSLDKFDYAIFVFKPDDLTNIRNSAHNTVRDNVIFELGLFIGRLGKAKVFYLVPKSSPNLHLPSDLLGHSPGVYDDSREDGNIRAALGPFCNQVRDELKQFLYFNISDFENESKSAKDIIVKKPKFWEYLLAIELLDSKLITINKSYKELDSDSIIQRKVMVDRDALLKFVQASFATYEAMSDQFVRIMKELTLSFGPIGQAGKPIEIKNAVDRLIQICKELLLWEYEVNSFVGEEKLVRVRDCMKGWSKVFIDQFNKIAPRLKLLLEEAALGNVGSARIDFELAVPEGLATINQLIIDSYE